MLLLRPPWPDRASTAWHCPDTPRPRLPPGSGTLRPGRPERPWRVWPGRTGPSHPVVRLPAPPPPSGTTGSPTHDSTPDPEPPPRPTHQPPPAPPHHDAHPDQTKSQTHNTPPTSGASTTRPHPEGHAPGRAECPRGWCVGYDGTALGKFRVLRPWSGTSCACGDIPSRSGTCCALGYGIAVPDGVECPWPQRDALGRMERPPQHWRRSGKRRAGVAGRMGWGRVAHTWRVLSMTSDHHAAGPGLVDATRRW